MVKSSPRSCARRAYEWSHLKGARLHTAPSAQKGRAHAPGDRQRPQREEAATVLGGSHTAAHRVQRTRIALAGRTDITRKPVRRRAESKTQRGSAVGARRNVAKQSARSRHCPRAAARSAEKIRLYESNEIDLADLPTGGERLQPWSQPTQCAAVPASGQQRSFPGHSRHDLRRAPRWRHRCGAGGWRGDAQ